MALVYTRAAFMVVFKSHNHRMQNAKSCLITLQVHTSGLDCEIITFKHNDFSLELKYRHKPHKLGLQHKKPTQATHLHPAISGGRGETGHLAETDWGPCNSQKTSNNRHHNTPVLKESHPKGSLFSHPVVKDPNRHLHSSLSANLPKLNWK